MNASLVATGTAALFLPLAPALGYPLSYNDALRVLESIFPVFLGHLGSATVYVIKGGSSSRFRAGSHALVGVLVRGPPAVFAIGCVSVFVAFYVTNRPTAPPGIGMSVNALARTVSALLGILTVSTSALSTHLFSTNQDARR